MSPIVHPKEDRELIYITGVFLFTLITEGQMDYKVIFNTETASFNSVPRGPRTRITKELNQPCIKVFGLENRLLIVSELTSL